MPGIERSGVTPEELVWDLENSIRSSRENKYAVQVGLKDQDFKLDKERIQTLCLTVPFRSIDQAEQALVDNLIYPTQCMEESYKTLTTRQ